MIYLSIVHKFLLFSIPAPNVYTDEINLSFSRSIDTDDKLMPIVGTYKHSQELLVPLRLLTFSRLI